MPLLSTFGSTGVQSFGNRGLKFGGSAFYNAGGDQLLIPQNLAAFSHSGNFTIEMWVYPTNLSVLNLIWKQSGAVYMWINPAGQVGWYHGSNPWSFSAATVNLNDWNHIAVVRNFGTVTIYVNGVGSGQVFNNNVIQNASVIRLGSWDGSALYQFFGYISNVRVAKQALYTSNFTPSGLPFTRVSQGSTTTTLLLNMNSAATLTTDSSVNNFSLTNISVNYSDFTPFLRPYVTPPTVVLQSATVTPSTFTPGEGTTISFSVVGTNTPNGTYYYTIEEDISTGAVTASDFTSGSLSGSFTMTSNSGNFSLTTTADLTTEDNETFVVYVRKDSTSGIILGNSGNITITDTSITPVFTVSPTSVNEGSSASFTVQNVGPDGTYYWTILNGTTDNSDFSSINGSFTVSGSTGGINNGSGSFSVPTAIQRISESDKTFQVQVRSGSVSGSVIISSSLITLVDIYKTPTMTVSSTYNEGVMIGPNVSNLGPAGTYYWTINHITTSSADFSSSSGSFTTTTLNESISFVTFSVNDIVTEGSETFTISVRSDSTSGPIIITSNTITINDTSRTQSASLTPDSTTVIEGTTLTINISTTNVPTGSQLTWRLTNQTTDPSDFSGGSGFFDGTSGIYNSGFGFGEITLDIASGDGPEIDETFQVELLGTAGQQIGITPVITISSNLT